MILSVLFIGCVRCLTKPRQKKLEDGVDPLKFVIQEAICKISWVGAGDSKDHLILQFLLLVDCCRMFVPADVDSYGKTTKPCVVCVCVRCV
jgi:hypothetical protein